MSLFSRAVLFPAALALLSLSGAQPGLESSGTGWKVAAPVSGESNVLSRLAAQGGRTGREHEFYLTRAVYSNGYGGLGSYGRRRNGSWATDWPKADEQFLSVLGRLAREMDSYGLDNPVRLDDPALRIFPFLYAVEVGWMGLSDAEVKGLRSYLKAGGFLIVDDFWGSYQWENFELNIKRVLPEYQIVDLPLSHELFRAYYEIDEILQVPNYGNGCNGPPYYEQDGYVPAVRAIFNERGRLLVLISWNSDLGDAWEWMELPCYPLKLSTYAYQLGVNAIIYSMTH